jgi:hypothetical protein
MLWYDTGTNILKMRSEADDAWINVAYLDQTANAFRILDDTQVVNTSGTQTGLIGDQATAAWEAGVATTESLVSPAKVKAAILALTPPATTYTDAQARAAQAGHTSGSVGSYIVAYNATESNVNRDATIAGSNLRVNSSSADFRLPFQSVEILPATSLEGTWRALVFSSGTTVQDFQNTYYPSFFLRIS